MKMRLVLVAIVLMAGFFAFGDYLQASTLSTPESFVADVGRGIGGVITGITSGVGALLGG